MRLKSFNKLFFIILFAIIAMPLSAVEIGTNDFQISFMAGVNGNTGFQAAAPDVAYNPTKNEYLVVWQGTDNENGLIASENEIFGQLLDAETGDPIGSRFQISDMGGANGDADFDATSVAAVYNPTNDEYLVVWSGDDNENGLVNGENEIFGQLIDADTGAETGANDFQISDMGGANGDTNYDANRPAVAYNVTNNEYLVVWHGDDSENLLVNGELEIFGQLINADTGMEIGTNDFQISDMGGVNGDGSYDARDPSVAYNVTDNEYLVVWEGEDNANGLVNNEFEIFGQRIDADTGLETGSNDFPISDMRGANGSSDPDIDFHAAHNPVVAYNVDDNNYMVVWFGYDTENGLIDFEFEIFGQLIEADTGMEIGSNDFQVSDVGGANGLITFTAFDCAITYNTINGEFLVIWEASDNEDGLIASEVEVFGQRIVASSGAETGSNDFQISDLGGANGNIAFSANVGAVAFNSMNNQYLAVWSGDDNENGLVDDEFEIFGQGMSDPICGNGFVDTGEECDDSNTDDGDGCDSSCVAEDGGTTGTGTSTGSGTGGSTGNDTNGGCSLIR